MLAWPLREVLLAYVDATRREALTQYRLNRLEHVVIAPWTKTRKSPPDLPAILKERRNGHAP